MQQGASVEPVRENSLGEIELDCAMLAASPMMRANPVPR
jgi:hypothetical protein